MTEQRPEWFNTLYNQSLQMAERGHFQFLETSLGVGRVLEEDPTEASRLARQALKAIVVHRSLQVYPIGESIQGSQLLPMLDDSAYPEDLRNLIRQELDLGHQR